MKELIVSAFWGLFPIWALAAILLLLAIPGYMAIMYPGNSFWSSKGSWFQDIVASKKRSMHYIRAFCLITLASYWFIDSRIISEHLFTMIIYGVKFSAGYIVINMLADSVIENRPW